MSSNHIEIVLTGRHADDHNLNLYNLAQTLLGLNTLTCNSLYFLEHKTSRRRYERFKYDVRIHESDPKCFLIDIAPVLTNEFNITLFSLTIEQLEIGDSAKCVCDFVKYMIAIYVLYHLRQMRKMKAKITELEEEMKKNNVSLGISGGELQKRLQEQAENGDTRKACKQLIKCVDNDATKIEIGSEKGNITLDTQDAAEMRESIRNQEKRDSGQYYKDKHLHNEEIIAAKNRDKPDESKDKL